MYRSFLTLTSLVILTVGNLFGQTCELAPIAVAAPALSHAVPGTTVVEVLNGEQSGNFGWLTWAGSPSEATLVTSLTMPGNSSAYVNPDQPGDGQVSIGDWVPFSARDR